MIASYWVGTDALTLVKLPPGKFIWRFRIWGRRIFWRLFWRRFVHFACAESKDSPLVRNLVKFGIPEDRIIICPVPVKYKNPVEKIPHDGFNVLFYASMGDGTNNKFKRWVYGVDIYEAVKAHYAKENCGWPGYGINFIYTDGKYNMNQVFPVIDVYIRPTRHDGAPCLVRECRINNIPVFWSNREDVTAQEVIAFIEQYRTV